MIDGQRGERLGRVGGIENRPETGTRAKRLFSGPLCQIDGSTRARLLGRKGLLVLDV